MMKKVLVVDDDQSIVDIVKYILVSRGFEVQTYTSPYNVPDVVADFNPDLILLDISLPGKLGTEICKELKKTINIPILLFSAYSNADQEHAGCNADGYIEKPFDLTCFIKTVNEHISNYDLLRI